MTADDSRGSFITRNQQDVKTLLNGGFAKIIQYFRQASENGKVVMNGKENAQTTSDEIS